jgi:tetratricopeptide (TPR) repeat protein
MTLLLALLLGWPQDPKPDGELDAISRAVGALARVADAKERLAQAPLLRERIENWVRRNPARPSAEQAHDLLVDLAQLTGTALLESSHPVAADASFLEAIARCERRVAAARTDADQTRLMFATFALVDAHRVRIERMCGSPALLPALDGAFRTLMDLVESYRWDFDTYVLPLVASTSAGRAARALAEVSPPADAERHWRNCFALIGATRSLLSAPEHLEPGLWGAHFEILARLGHAEFLRGRSAPFRQVLDEAVRLGREALGAAGPLRDSDAGANVALSLAEAHLARGEPEAARALIEQARATRAVPSRLRRIFRAHAESMTPEMSTAHAEDLVAEGRYDEAIPLYRRLASGADSPHLWGRLAECLYRTDRVFEALAAVSRQLELEPTRPAAELRLKALRQAATLSKDPELAERERSHLQWMLDRGWLPWAETRNAAIAAERRGDHGAALAVWERLADDSDPHRKSEALARLAYNTFRLERDPAETLRRIQAHLAFATSLDRHTPESRREIVQSLYLGTFQALRRLRHAAAALELSKGLPKYAAADPDLAMRAFALRVEARIARRDFDGAEAEHARLEELYEFHKTGASTREASRSILAHGLLDESERVRTSDPELSRRLLERGVHHLPAGDFEKNLALAPKLLDAADRTDRFARAREMFENLLGANLARVRSHSDSDLEFKLRYGLARALLGEGNLPRAESETMTLIRQAPSDPDLFDLAGEIKLLQAAGLRGAAQAKAYAECAELSGKAAVGCRRVGDTSGYYRNLYRYCAALFETPDGFETLRRVLEQRRRTGEAPDWDGGEWKAKFDALERAVELRTPKR